MSFEDFAYDTTTMDTQDLKFDSRRSSQHSYSQPRTSLTSATSEHAHSPELEAVHLNEMTFSQGSNYTTGQEFACFDFDQYVDPDTQYTHNDACSLPSGTSLDGSHNYTTGTDSWLQFNYEDYRTASHSSVYHSITQSPPISPLTELSSDFTSTSSCSESSYALASSDNNFIDHVTGMVNADDPVAQWTILSSGFLNDPNGFQDSLQQPAMSPVLTTKPEDVDLALFAPLPSVRDYEDAQRTIRASKHTSRPSLPVVKAREPSHCGSDDSRIQEPEGEKVKDSAEKKPSRVHQYYFNTPNVSDGLYHCPFESEGCLHPPTKQKCGYDKYVDSHLKPFRCKFLKCADAQFSSAACRLRHEREAHGLHGHGMSPYICKFDGCERSVDGNGFPRRWNLNDHMKRVHDYVEPDTPGSSPRSQPGDKKDAARKRKGPSATLGSQAMKKTRSTQSNSSVSSKIVKNQGGRHGQLQNVRGNFDNARARMHDQFAHLDFKDPANHAQVNATVQEMNNLAADFKILNSGQWNTPAQVPLYFDTDLTGAEGNSEAALLSTWTMENGTMQDVSSHR